MFQLRYTLFSQIIIVSYVPRLKIKKKEEMIYEVVVAITNESKL